MSKHTRNTLLAQKLGEALRAAETEEHENEERPEKIKSPEEIDRMFEKLSLLSRLQRTVKSKGKKPDVWYWAMYELPLRLVDIDIPTREDACIVQVIDADGKAVKSAIVPFQERKGKKVMETLLDKQHVVTAAIEREKHRRYE